jgi:hypothetical protein
MPRIASAQTSSEKNSGRAADIKLDCIAHEPSHDLLRFDGTEIIPLLGESEL